MARTRTYETYLILSVSSGDEHEIVLAVEYDFMPGSAGSWDEPPYGPSAEVTALRATKDGKAVDLPTWLSDLIEADELLLDSLVEDACEQDANDKADAAERRAEADRDDRLMGVR